VTTPPARIRAKFLKWVYLEDVCECNVTGEGSTATRLEVAVKGMPVLTAEVLYEAQPCTPGFTHTPSPASPIPQALDLSIEDLEGKTGHAYTATDADASSAFPELSRLIGARAVAEIVSCSYIVGMEAPGLHSMFSRLDVAIRQPKQAPNERTALDYRVSSLDSRFRKGQLEVSGAGIHGTLEFFVRNPPVAQATMKAVAARVQPGEFAGMRALVIGGSRGLGELTAKLIAAGGGSSTITYAIGRVEAEAVAAEIHAAGAEIDILSYDVQLPAAPQLAQFAKPVTHLFYFATNAIFRPKGDLVSPPILAAFSAFYLHGFYDLCHEMTRIRDTRQGRLVVYYPSSIAVEVRPAGMTEYSMIKVAGELMCKDMNRFMPGLHIFSTRLPRLRTDQTAGVLPEREQEPIDVLLPILREMQKFARASSSRTSLSSNRPGRQLPSGPAALPTRTLP